jgi:hypothetical protein
MINFERSRLEYILQKETEINYKEKNIKIVSDCSNKNDKLTQALNGINKIIENTGFSSSNKYDIKNNNIVKGIENIITGKIDSNIVANPNQLSCVNNNNNNNNYNNNNNNDNIIVNDNNNKNDVDKYIEQNINTKILSEVPAEYINRNL